MSEESMKILGINRKCGCKKSNIKIATVGQKAVVTCTNCGERTRPCSKETDAIFLWNNGFTL